jgi:hypothetical protein
LTNRIKERELWSIEHKVFRKDEYEFTFGSEHIVHDFIFHIITQERAMKTFKKRKEK